MGADKEGGGSLYLQLNGFFFQQCLKLKLLDFQIKFPMCLLLIVGWELTKREGQSCQMTFVPISPRPLFLHLLNTITTYNVYDIFFEKLYIFDSAKIYLCCDKT